MIERFWASDRSASAVHLWREVPRRDIHHRRSSAFRSVCGKRTRDEEPDYAFPETWPDAAENARRLSVPARWLPICDGCSNQQNRSE